jgi:glycosyltransferase involved in cell wall biosynthesis
MIGNIHLQDQSIQGYYSRPFYIRFFIKFSLKFSDVQLTTSKIELEGIIKLGAKKPHFIYHAIDVNKYEFSPVENRKNFLLCVSRFFMFNIKRKKLIELLFAFSKIHTQIPDYQLVLVGNKDDDGFEYLMSEIKKLNLTDKVILPGFISEIEKLELYKKCCLYLQPTEYEGFGMAIAENMASGSPIITSKKGAVEEIADGCVMFVDPNNPEEIANGIISLIYDVQLRKQFSEKGRLRIIKSFQIENRKLAIKELFDSLFNVK